MGTAPLCRIGRCKTCGNLIHHMLDYCGEDYFDRSKDGLCLKKAKISKKKGKLKDGKAR